MKLRISYNASGVCEIDFEDKLKKVSYRYFSNVGELKKMLESVGDRVWIAKLDNFEKWLKAYRNVVDLGYLVFYENGKIERIINVHIHYSVWLERPAVRFAEIAEFTSEFEEDED